MKLEKWASIREKGKQRFVLVYGVLGWGVSTGLLWSILMAFIEPSENLGATRHCDDHLSHCGYRFWPLNVE